MNKNGSRCDDPTTRRLIYIRRVVDAAPQLTPEKFDYLASLFRKTGGI